MSGNSRLARLALLLSAALGVVSLPRVSRGQDVVQPEVANSRFQFSGAINSGDVYIRSGPGEAYYTTLKVPQGTQITVVGIKFDWLKILPPPGSFCYVSKLFIERRGDGTIGRASKSDINVRAGSVLNPTKTTVLCKLNSGDDVKILGEEDEYYKIAPPEGTFFYVNKQFVDPVHVLAANVVPVGDAPPQEEPAGPVVDSAPSTRPTDIAADAPATQPVVAEAPPAPSPGEIAETNFQALEADFNSASQKPLEQQPISEISKRYDALVQANDLVGQDKETAGFRLAVLKVRLDAQQRLAQVTQMEASAAKKDQVLKAEQDELQKRLDANEVHLYAAVGTLQASSLQYGSQTLYRLTDPANGRTVIYLRGDDQAASKLMDQFVGVRGDAATDEKLNIKVIPFSVIEVVDPAQVNTKVIAGIEPPSMMPQAIQASAANN